MAAVEISRNNSNKRKCRQFNTGIAAGLLAQSKQWEAWVEKNPTVAFDHEFIYRNSKKEQFKQPVYQVLLHLFNHSTYHRGQLVTMMRYLGIERMPATDFIVFTRAK